MFCIVIPIYDTKPIKTDNKKNAPIDKGDLNPENICESISGIRLANANAALITIAIAVHLYSEANKFDSIGI